MICNIINDVNLIQIEDVEIKLVINNETNFENIFIFDSNNKNIENITFLGHVLFNENITHKELSSRKCFNIENMFLFYSFRYQISFGHFIEQCLPKFNLYINLKKEIPSLKFCIPGRRYNTITKNIVSLLGINDKDILILNDDYVYIINNFYYKNYECTGFDNDKINTFNLIRRKLKITENVNPYRNVYLKKNNNDIPEKDCYNIGKTRIIINEDILISYLRELNFEIITLGECDLFEKNKILTDINILITQSGGNMYYLIFSNTPKHVCFLTNTEPIHVEYICDLLPKLSCYTIADVTRLSYNSIYENGDSTNKWNSPFIVNIDDITKYCSNILQ
jgi:hypothetical protein